MSKLLGMWKVSFGFPFSIFFPPLLPFGLSLGTPARARSSSSVGYRYLFSLQDNKT